MPDGRSWRPWHGHPYQGPPGEPRLALWLMPPRRDVPAAAFDGCGPEGSVLALADRFLDHRCALTAVSDCCGNEGQCPNWLAMTIEEVRLLQLCSEALARAEGRRG